MQSFTKSREFARSAEAVVEAIATEAYLRFRYDDSTLQSFDLDIQQDDDEAFRYKLVRSGKPDNLPSIARKVVGDTITLIQEQTWSRTAMPYQGSMRLLIEGAPGEIVNNLSLHDLGDGRCEMRVEASIEVKVPLLGGRLEKILVSKAEEGFAKSMQAIQDYLDQL